MARTRKDADSLPDNYKHCNGCGEAHHPKDFVSVCVKCLQAKFIPRLGWHEVGFIDQKSQEQWWNHYKELQVEKLLAELEKQKEEYLLRAAWEVKDEDEEDVILPPL